MDVQSQQQQAIAAHRAGDLARAEALYRQVLRADRDNVPALHMLGFLCAQQSRYDEAVRLIGRALERQPGDVAALVDQPAAPHLADLVYAVGKLIAAVLDVDASLRQRKVAAVDIGDARHQTTDDRRRRTEGRSFSG